MKRQTAWAVVILAALCTFASDPGSAWAEGYDWSGSTIGFHIGGGRGSSTWNDARYGYLGSNNPSGVIAGVQAGFDQQFGQLVLGVYGDVSWSGVEGDHADEVFTYGRAPETDRGETDFLGTLTGRLGRAWGPTLLYGKWGLAWARTTYSLEGFYSPGTEFAEGNVTRLGWTLGGGFEYRMAAHWTCFFEYDFLGLGTDRIDMKTTRTDIPPIPYTIQIDIGENLSIFKGGIGYRF